ncbi:MULTISPECIES: hypothetical protein [unclassified Bradyrhizobium]
MTHDAGTRDRVIRLQTKLEHVTAQLSNVQIKVNTMHDLLMQARGVRWMIFAIAAMAGFLASFITKYLHLPLSNWAGTTTFPTALRTYGRRPVGRRSLGLRGRTYILSAVRQSAAHVGRRKT